MRSRLTETTPRTRTRLEPDAPDCEHIAITLHLVVKTGTATMDDWLKWLRENEGDAIEMLIAADKQNVLTVAPHPAPQRDSEIAKCQDWTCLRPRVPS